LIVFSIAEKEVLDVNQNETALFKAPVNPDYIKYWQNYRPIRWPKQGYFIHQLGYIPDPVDMSYLKGKKVSKEMLAHSLLGEVGTQGSSNTQVVIIRLHLISEPLGKLLQLRTREIAEEGIDIMDAAFTHVADRINL
jgi:hypothetical protein